MVINEKMQQKNIERLNAICGNDAEYRDFLGLVRTQTIVAFESFDFSQLLDDETWSIEGAEFRLDPSFVRSKHSDYRQYSDATIKRALDEVPALGLKENSSWRYKRDFQNAEVKLGCLVVEGVTASPILDLGYLMELFAQYGIPCYIDYENEVFHINAKEPVKENKQNKQLGLAN